MTDFDPTERMSDAELASYYEEHGLEDFKGGEVVAIDPGPKDSIVSVRFAAAELDAVERQAGAAGMKLTAYIRASALSGAQVVDLDRLRKVAARIVADTQEMGQVVNLPTGRAPARTVTRSAQTGKSANASKSGAAKTRNPLKRAAAKAQPTSAASRASTRTAASSALNRKAPTKAPSKEATASKPTGREAQESPQPKGRS